MITIDNLLAQVGASAQAKHCGETAVVSRTAEKHHDQASGDNDRRDCGGKSVRQPEPVAGVLVHRRDRGECDLGLRRLVRRGVLGSEIIPR